jgi:hypothetical protein
MTATNESVCLRLATGNTQSSTSSALRRNQDHPTFKSILIYRSFLHHRRRYLRLSPVGLAKH